MPEFVHTPPQDDSEYSATEHKLLRAKRLIDLYFSPWGAAKAAQWEEITNDRAFTADVAVEMVRRFMG